MFDRLYTYYQLGPRNLFRVFLHRYKVKQGIYSHTLPVRRWQYAAQDHCFIPQSDAAICCEFKDELLARADRLLAGERQYFFDAWFKPSSDDQWSFNPFIEKTWKTEYAHWSKVSYFDEPGNDIKVIWELSRFYWAPQLALAYRLSSNEAYLDYLNKTIQRWCRSHTINAGYQWLCAQEAGIRLINLLLVDFILGESASSHALTEIVVAHVKRILPTLSYAIAQQNNHATSEASALYIAGHWLLQHESDHALQKMGRKAHKLGKMLLEKHANKLILQDGSFSQYSVTYHRLVLDTLSLSVFFQRHWKLESFKPTLMRKFELAFQWLYQLTDLKSGDAVNLGSNDGVLLFKLDTTDYRDFRPSLQLASVLLYDQVCFDDMKSCTILEVLHLQSTSQTKVFEKKSADFSRGGFLSIVQPRHWLMLRYPRFKFRPSQCDAMHLDLWVDGENVLCDSGTYSYNPARESEHFNATENHNIVMWKNKAQMRRSGRFLWSGWPVSKVVAGLKENGADITYAVGAKFASGYQHLRAIRSLENKVIVQDTVTVPSGKVKLLWHLGAGDWMLDNDVTLVGQKIKLQVFSGGDRLNLSLLTMRHSRYYHCYEEHTVCMIEQEAEGPIHFRTEIEVLI